MIHSPALGKHADHLFWRQLTCSTAANLLTSDPTSSENPVTSVVLTGEENTFECQDHLPGKASNHLNCQHISNLQQQMGLHCASDSWPVFGSPMCCLIFFTLNTLLALLLLSFVTLLCGVISLCPSPEILSLAAFLPLLKVLLPALPFLPQSAS